MDAEVKEKWVTALRSGEYEQGKFKLKVKHEDGSLQYCCLGVLGEVLGLESYDPYQDNVFPIHYSFGHGHDTAYLSVRDSDLTTEQTQMLVKMNDDEGKTFEEIADWIEENL